jgi:DNA-binding NarL/FixJ family response regulator
VVKNLSKAQPNLSNRKAALSVSVLGESTAVIFDRHPLWLEAIEPVVNRLGIELVGKTTSSSTAIQLVEEREPTLLILEIEDEEDDGAGLRVLRKAREHCPDVKAVILSTSDDPTYIDAAFEAGAAAYVVKTAQPEDLASAIRQAFEPSIYLRSVPGSSAQPEMNGDGDGAGAELTRRELEILRLVAEGHSNAKLAAMLWVTEQTVKFHLSNIYRKLDVSNRTEASRWAQLNGILPAAASAA